MADILIDVEVRGNQKVTNAVKDIQALQNNVKRLSDAMSKGSLSQRQYYKGIAQLAEATGKSEKELRDYATTLRRVEKETKAAKVAQDQEREAVKAYAQARREATAANQRYDAELKKKAKAEEEAARAAAKHASEMEQIKNKYVPLYAASKQYERAIEELNQAYVQGALTQGQYLAAMDNIDTQLANNTSSARGNTRSMNAVGMAVQQTGYQVGDFLVQIQSGTNAFVAFGQQATQLVGILPMMAEQFGMNATRLAFIATGLGIAIPLFTAVGAAIMRTREANRDAADSVKTLDDELKSLNTTLKDWVNTKKASQLGLTVEELLGTRGIEEAQEQLQDARKSLAEFQRQIQAGGLVGGGILGAGDYFKTFFDEDEASKFEAALRKVIDAENTLATLRQKQGEEQFDNFSDQTRELNQQIELNKAILTFGKESAQVKSLELQQEIESRNRIIDQQVKAKEITVAQGVALKALTEDFVRSEAALEGSVALSETFKSVMESIKIDNLLSQMDSLNSKLGSAIFGAGTMSARLRGLFDDGVAAAERAKIQQDQQRARQEGFRFDKTKTEGGISKTEAFFSGNVGFSNIPKDIDNPVGLPGKKTSGSKKQTPGEKADDYLRKLELEAKYKESIIGLSEREARIQEIIKELKQKELPIDEKRIQNLVDMEEKVRKLTEAEQQREQMMDMIESNIENAFMSIVDGSKSVEDAFRSMLRNIILAIYQQKVAEPAANAIGSLIDKGIAAIFSANGNVFNQGMHVKAYADGGVVNRTTAFPMRGGVGIMGEAGPEAIMPLKRGKNGKLGVQMEGSSGDVVIHQNFNFSANGDDSVKRIIRGEIPRITEATKAAVVDAKRRGGSYGRSF